MSVLRPNLQATLDTLPAERIVTRAAERLQLSPSAMKRALARLRNGMVSFNRPAVVPAITTSPYRHPHLQADPARQWLRGCARAVSAPPDAARSTTEDDDAKTPRP